MTAEDKDKWAKASGRAPAKKKEGDK
jgi:hypothetical protein